MNEWMNLNVKKKKKKRLSQRVNSIIIYYYAKWSSFSNLYFPFFSNWNKSRANVNNEETRNKINREMFNAWIYIREW